MHFTIPPAVQKFLDDLDKKLHEPNVFTDALNTIETSVGIKRLHLVVGMILIHALYLVIGYAAELLCNTIGFLYPAYMSIKAVESAPKEDDTHWLTYWIIFALFNVFDFFSSTVTKYFPVYWLVKCAFLLWLYLPMTMGAQKVYQNFVKPFMLKHQSTIDKRFGSLAAEHVVGSTDNTAEKEFEQHVKPN
ncbi:unnamed protein product [Enterobius vermicularis]|uniref:Receptor expression-enhancing protein n=1 Tax=Enterobius vermicularis TaxID=51028 RepID=A0A0N4UUZ4_ENTVE|nr:unnamed protein product [Enterobius vermicularis]